MHKNRKNYRQVKKAYAMSLEHYILMRMNPQQPNQQNPQNLPPNQGYTSSQPPAQQPRQAMPQRQPVQPRLPDEPEPSLINTDDIPSNSTYRDGLKPPPQRSKFLTSFKGLISVIELVGGALLLALAINSFVFQSYQVFGQSMEPTLQQGNRLIISKIAKSWAGAFNGQYLPDRGTVIVFTNPRNPDIQLVKRVIGHPGERVLVANGSITVFNDAFPDGFNPDAEYEDFLADFTTGEIDITVPEGQVFVSGDNRTPGGSLDSRNDLGTVPLDHIIGNLSVRIFPLSDAKFF